mmetsp:Transcript_65574/g.170716  ORF Transcript_65574/g.170716 Transcript_65574/m.170716 type:complete len:210 (+) Transcript_65574:1213-1842(+)
MLRFTALSSFFSSSMPWNILIMGIGLSFLSAESSFDEPASGDPDRAAACSAPASRAWRRISRAASSIALAASSAAFLYSTSASTRAASCSSPRAPISSPKRRWRSLRRAAASAAAGDSVSFCSEKLNESSLSFSRSTFRNSFGAPTSASSSAPPPSRPMRPPGARPAPPAAVTLARLRRFSRAAPRAIAAPALDAAEPSTRIRKKAGTP